MLMNCLLLLTLVLFPETIAKIVLKQSQSHLKESDSLENSIKLIQDHVKVHAKETFREPSGYLRFPYLVPAGPYEQSWDWDSLFMGVGLLNYGSQPYFEGTFKNFLDHTNLTTGDIEGCLTPSGPTGTIYHAKPVIIQGAWLAARSSKTPDQSKANFQEFEPQMEALLEYWSGKPTFHPNFQLNTWHDQLQTGSDNLVTSICPSLRSQCWVEDKCQNTLSSSDLMVFLIREYQAFKQFLQSWADLSSKDSVEYRRLIKKINKCDRKISNLRKAMDAYLWNDDLGHYVAFNTSTSTHINSRVWLMAMPLWGKLASSDKYEKIMDNLLSSDMYVNNGNVAGIRSTSNQDVRYNNDNIIKPYSNWRGPLWVNANAIILYGMSQYENGKVNDIQAKDEDRHSLTIAKGLIRSFANDLVKTGTWHECISSENGEGLAAKGFLSWNTLLADLYGNLESKLDPFKIE